MYLPGLPARVCQAAVAISATAPVLLQVIGALVRLRKSATVDLRPAFIRMFGIQHRTARRTLRQLEAAGLIQLDTAPGRAPRVTITTEDYLAWLLNPGRGGRG